MKGNEIPSLTDKEWARKNEIGTITKTLEYHTGIGTGTAKVSVTAQIISGEEIDAIEAECSTIDLENEDNPVEIEQDKFTMRRFCRIFGIDEDTYHDIMKKKYEGLKASEINKNYKKVNDALHVIKKQHRGQPPRCTRLPDYISALTNPLLKEKRTKADFRFCQGHRSQHYINWYRKDNRFSKTHYN